jgi:hypothetical protein
MGSMQCNVEFGYQLSICSGTKESLQCPRVFIPALISLGTGGGGHRKSRSNCAAEPTKPVHRNEEITRWTLLPYKIFTEETRNHASIRRANSGKRAGVETGIACSLNKPRPEQAVDGCSPQTREVWGGCEEAAVVCSEISDKIYRRK